MCEAHGVHVVRGLDELGGIVLHDGYRQATLGQVVEEVALGRQLRGNEGNLRLLEGIFIGDRDSGVRVLEFDNVGVLELLEDGDLVLDERGLGGVLVAEGNNLQSALVLRSEVFGLVDLSAGALTEFFLNAVVVEHVHLGVIIIDWEE